MGQSTDAILAYGYVWDEEVDEDEFAPEEANNLWGDEHPVQIGYHCSCDYSMPYVYVTKSRRLASRGYPIAIDAREIGTPDSWVSLLADFCQKHNIDVGEKQPGWFLCSMWC